MATKTAKKKTASKSESRAERLRRNMTNQRGRTLFKKYTQELKAAFPSGKSYIRILPWDAKDVEAPPMVTIAQHFNIAGEVVPCLNVFEDGGGFCPVCDKLDEARSRMEKEEYWAWAQPMRATKRFCVWGIDLMAPNKGAKIYELPKKVGEMIFDKFNDADDGVWWKPGNVYDFKIVKTGSGMTTNYDKSEKTTKYANVKTPKLAKPLTDLTDLFVLDDSTEDWQEYIKKLLARSADAEDGSDAEASSDVVEDEEVSEEVKERTSKKKKTKPAEDESEEVEEEAGSDDAEEEEVEESEDAPVKKSAKKKTKPAEDESEEAEEEVESDDAEAEDESEEEEEAPKKKPAKKKTKPAEDESEEVEEDESEEVEEDESEEVEEDESDEAEEVSEEEEAPKKKKKTKPAAEEESEEAEEEEAEEDEEESEEAPKKKAPAKKKGITAAEMRKKLKNAKR